MSNPRETSRPRALRLVALAAGIALCLLAPAVLPLYTELFRSSMRLMFPLWVRSFFDATAGLLAFAAISVPLTRRPGRIGGLTVPPGVWDRLEGMSSWVLGGRLATVLAVVIGLMIGTWLPHYLTWPWWADTEHFAVSAMSWSVGVLPYRDLHDFNFPGPTYIHWLLGTAFGWGRTSPYYVLDAALLIGLCIALARWSRERFGGTVPGLVGALAAIAYYLGLSYDQVAQRDWHAALLSALGLLALETRRDRIGLVASALAFAAALTIRPHPVVFLPAILSAIDENARLGGEPRSRTVRAVAIWSGVLAMGLLAGAAPVVLSGLSDDFLRWSRIAWFGGTYHGAATRDFWGILLDQPRRWETGVLLVSLAIMALTGSTRRRAARTWFLALLGVLFYMPLSPVLHSYLVQPLMLIWSVALAEAVGAALTWTRPRPTVRLLAVALFVSYAVPGLPYFCRPRASFRAVVDLVRGETPVIPPPGCETSLTPRLHRRFYSWEDYRDLLAHLRRTTGPRTFVANVLRRHPFPTINGPVGRLSVFPAAAGVLWLRFAAPGQEVPFAEALARPRDAVVVWVPGERPPEASLRLERLEEAIRRDYGFEARFGTIEVWRRNAGPPPDGARERDVDRDRRLDRPASRVGEEERVSTAGG